MQRDVQVNSKDWLQQGTVPFSQPAETGVCRGHGSAETGRAVFLSTGKELGLPAKDAASLQQEHGVGSTPGKSMP